MSKDCTKYVESGEICAMANRSYTAPIPLHNKPIPDGPLQSISIDILSIATPSNKYRQIFVAVCDFSKILIAKPMMNKTGKNTAKMIFQNIILTLWDTHSINHYFRCRSRYGINNCTNIV